MEDALYTRILQFLTIRLRSEKEIRDYITKQLQKPHIAQGVSDKKQLTEQLIERLKKQNFLDDLAFAIAFIRSRTVYKPKGKKIIAYELQQKGIAQTTIDEAFVSFTEDSSVDDIRDEVAIARQLLEKKRSAYEKLPKRERFQKAGSMLARKGFDMDTIRKAIDGVFGK